jgi:hypothetical protein
VLRRLRVWWLGAWLAVFGIAYAAPPDIDVTVTPAWKGWSRPGRASELDIRVSSNVATQATLDVRAGRQTVRAELALEPGRVLRLQLPVSSTADLAASVSVASAPLVRRDITVAQSESPVLGVGVANEERVQLDGFHSVALTSDDLPRNASAYASVDALILDAATLRALDPRQLGALLAHAAACGRIAVVSADERVRRVFEGAGGCGGRALLSAPTLAEARALLVDSLSLSLPSPLPAGGVGELLRPEHAQWNGVAVMLAVYVAVAVLVSIFFSAWPVMLLVPGLAAVASLGVLHALRPQPQLVIWSEGDAGAALARYQAWQRFPGGLRERVRVPIPPLLAASVRPCDARQSLRLEVDAGRGEAAHAAFETRLFQQVSLCYAGSFPMSRALATTALADGAREVRNVGTSAWPAGLLLADGQARELPALAPGANATLATLATLATNSGRPPRDALLRIASSRNAPGGVAALWPLDLAGVAEVPANAKGWLLVVVPVR